QLRESNNNIATVTPTTVTTQQTTIQPQIKEEPVLRSNRVQLPQQKTSIKNILVVDDSNIILMQVRKAMGSLPYHLQTASSAKKALEMLNTEAVDLIITDVNMPEMNGIDLTLKIRKEVKHLRVIIMTAFENAEMKKQQTNILFTDKPLSLGHVTNLINQMNEGNDFGKLNNLKLKDLIFMLVLSKKDEYILVTDSQNNQGKVFLSCGDVIHAEYSNLKGKEALDMIAKFEQPSLEVIEGKANERSINTDVNTILYSL
ncbi:MAG: response regulator, partial [Candidatus Sericytochromatia bacterium]